MSLSDFRHMAGRLRDDFLGGSCYNDGRLRRGAKGNVEIPNGAWRLQLSYMASGEKTSVSVVESSIDS